ncbi:uncharacterized protein LOC143078624 [Mytilus galloprovincialis]|uniref:uncharacterized protein LOC143078624 n=1 Tax=Mytilus galloprovincialis TaxID=29158 RepID=UPI003F7C7D9E
MELEQKEDDINQERDYNSVLLSQIGFVTHLNGGQSQNLQNLEQTNQTLEQTNQTLEQTNQTLEQTNQTLEQEKETQFRHIQNLEQEKETQKAIIEEQNERLRKYKIDDRYLRKQLAKKDRINQDLHDQLKDVNMLCNKMKKQLQTLLQKK